MGVETTGGAAIGAVERRWPWTVVLLIVALSLIEPVSHLWIAHAPPPGTRPSGLHTLDTYAYHSAMLYFGDGYYSPYATCQSPVGDRDPSLYALPHHHLYGWAGILTGGWLPPFQALGLVNGLGMALMLVCAWRLLRDVFPALSYRAFLLFCLWGGAGGLLYVVAALTGWRDTPGFAGDFFRFFRYELSEGPRFQPHLLAERLYYIVALSAGFFTLRSIFFSQREERALYGVIWGAFGIGICSFLNFRVGPMVWGVSALLILSAGGSWGRRLLGLGLNTLGLAVGGGVAVGMLSQNPELGRGALGVLSEHLWLVAFFWATCWAWWVLPGELLRGFRGASGLWRGLAGAGIGYLVCYTVLYLGYLAYFGGWLRGGDTSAAVAVSDWALLGGVAGFALGLLTSAREDGEGVGLPVWVSLWFLGGLGLAVSAWGQGWFLQYMPQRFLVVLGIPLALLTAAGIARLERRRPWQARAVFGTILCSGVVSILLTWGHFYGPHGYETGQRLFEWTRFAFISEEDGELLDSVEGGVLLTPSLEHPLFGDVAALRPGMRVVYGNGTLDYSRLVMPEVKNAVAHFYSAGADAAAREALLTRYCVDFVYCPADPALDGAVMAALRGWERLEVVREAGAGAVFRVLR